MCRRELTHHAEEPLIVVQGQIAKFQQLGLSSHRYTLAAEAMTSHEVIMTIHITTCVTDDILVVITKGR